MTAPPGLFTSLRRAAVSAVGLARTRLALLGVEVREEGERLLGLALWALAAVLLGVAGLVFLAVLLTVLLWDSQRLLALAIFTTAFLGAAVFALSNVARLARQGSQLFAASLAELHRDEAALSADRPAPRERSS